MILVVGGTGELGGRVVRMLGQNGQQVRCLLRPDTDDARLRQLSAAVVRGDLIKPGSLPPACEGIGTVVASVTAMGRHFAIAERLTGRAINGNASPGRSCDWECTS
jgi:uncharacterized protein YbjT (DUF2867 family)